MHAAFYNYAQYGRHFGGAGPDGEPTLQEIKDKLKPAGADDGTFWIARKDFITEFRSISICMSDAGLELPPRIAANAPTSTAASISAGVESGSLEYGHVPTVRPSTHPSSAGNP